MLAYQIGNRFVLAYPGQYIRVLPNGQVREVVNYLTNGLCVAYEAMRDGTLRRVWF